MTHKRETVGKISTDLLMKESPTQSPVELEREMQKEYMDSLIKCVQDNKVAADGDFFIHVETKCEHLMKNVFRNYFIARKTCPTPFYDQSVYHYSCKDEHLTYLWTIPAKDVCEHFRLNALFVAPEEQALLGFVLDYESGELLKKAQKLNGETSDISVILSLES